MRQTAYINPDVMPENIRRLAASMVIQALCDAKNKRKPVETRLEALMWLTGDDFGTWAEAANYPFADVFGLLTTGRLKRIRIKSKGKMNEQ